MDLTKVQELTARRREDIYKRIKETNVIELLKYVTSHSDVEDAIFLSQLLEFRNSLIERIESDHRWKYTVDGFLNVSNFSYESDSINFIANFIPRDENGFYVDDTCTEKAHSHYSYFQELFDELNKVDRLLYDLYLDKKEPIDELLTKLESLKTFQELPEELKNGEVLKVPETQLGDFDEDMMELDCSMIQTYASVYRERGLEYLINWLNECNGSKTTEELFAKLVEEIKPFATTGRHSNEFFDERFSIVLGNYSIRGLHLRRLYREAKQKDFKKLKGHTK